MSGKRKAPGGVPKVPKVTPHSSRPKASRIFLYSCLIVPVTFYAGYLLRGRRVTSSEDSDHRPALVAESTPPHELVKRLREEEKSLDTKRLDIERKIAELQLRARKPQD